MLSQEKRQEIIDEYAIHENDTGSAQVQVAVLTEKIKQLTEHLKVHKKDFNSRRGLETMVGRRKSLLNYLKNNDVEEYRKLIDKLNLKG
ncbi:MAG: 30S ribosomal protein S15 [Bacillota bacterium]